MIALAFSKKIFQPILFKLNHASGSSARDRSGGEKEFMLWVGDLTSDVDDVALYKAFANCYNSIKSVKGNF